MNALGSILNSFKEINLADAERARLVNRIDTKYILNQAVLLDLLQGLEEEYQLLTVDGNALTAYKTLYFDTPDFTNFRKHHNEAAQRFKIRWRNYLSNNKGFLEIKYKNKNRTSKNRIRFNEVPIPFNEACNNFIEANTGFKGNQLEPKLWINYQRITLVHKVHNERLTIDQNLEFNWDSKSCQLNNVVVLELKRNGTLTTAGHTAIKRLHLKPLAFSKYCVGISYIYPGIKQNNFKPTLTIINKLTHDQSFNPASGSR